MALLLKMIKFTRAFLRGFKRIGNFLGGKLHFKKDPAQIGR